MRGQFQRLNTIVSKPRLLDESCLITEYPENVHVSKETSINYEGEPIPQEISASVSKNYVNGEPGGPDSKQVTPSALDRARGALSSHALGKHQNEEYGWRKLSAMRRQIS
jgi:hypothetical protein